MQEIKFIPKATFKYKCVVLIAVLYLYPRPGRDADHSPPSSAEVKKE
jgi:hypothetical protein